MEEQFYDLSSFAVDDPAMEGMSLIDSIKKVKPNILIGKLAYNCCKHVMYKYVTGLSACGGLFNEDVLKAMNENEAPPIIFPLSNPTSRSECTAEQAQAATGGQAIFASGSPFPDMEINGKMVASSQCNNR